MITCFVALQDITDILNAFDFMDVLTEENWQKGLVVFHGSWNSYTFWSFCTNIFFFLFSWNMLILSKKHPTLSQIKTRNTVLK